MEGETQFQEDRWRLTEKRNQGLGKECEGLKLSQQVLIKGQDDLRQEKDQLGWELEQVRSRTKMLKAERDQLSELIFSLFIQGRQVRSQLTQDYEQQILQRENDLVLELTRLRSEVAEAEEQSKIVADNDHEIRKVLLPLITPKKKGGAYTPSNATALRDAAEHVLTLLTPE